MSVDDNGMTCAYCGQKKEHVAFFIGAKMDNDIGWTMHEGTAKISCPNCYPKGKEEARLVIERVTKS